MSSAAQRIAKEAAAKRQREEDAKTAEAAAEAVEEDVPTPDTAEAEEELSEELEGPEALLTSLEGGPTAAEIAQWRERFDSIYALSLRDDDWYVWRYMTLAEWREIQAGLAGVTPEEAEEWIKNQVLARTVVWPREKVLDPRLADKQPANLKDLLYEVVMAGSYFMPTEQALRQTLRL